MKKILSLLLLLTLGLALLAGCTPKTDGGGDGDGEPAPPTRLNLYTWEGMFPSEVLAEFEQRTGIAVNYANFDYGENMLTKLQAVNGGEYDLVIVDDYIIEMAIAQGLAQPLDKAKLPNYGNINPLYQGQFYDPGDLYTVPYGAGVQTIVYNPAAVTKPIAGYADLWDASLKGTLGVVGNFRVINGMALKVLGQSYNTEDLVQIRAAGDKLLELAPNIRLIKDDNLQDDLVMGEINAAVMYTSQVTMAKLAMPELEVVYPTEGIGFGIMAGFIPSQAPSAEAAHLFLNYLLEPEVAAQCFEWLGYYCTTEAAEPYIAEEFRSFLTLPEGFSLEMEMIQNIGTEAMDLHAEIFTEFKTACGQ